MKKNAKLTVYMVSFILAAIVYLVYNLINSDAGAQINDSAALEKVFTDKGYTLEAMVLGDDEINNTLLSVVPKRYFVSGEPIAIYTYATKADLDKDISIISKDGLTVGAMFLSWISDPHFFANEHVIVEYIGKDEKILQILEQLFGEQFAGL